MLTLRFDYSTYGWLLPLDVHREIVQYCRRGVRPGFQLLDERTTNNVWGHYINNRGVVEAFEKRENEVVPWTNVTTVLMRKSGQLLVLADNRLYEQKNGEWVVRESNVRAVCLLPSDEYLILDYGFAMTPCLRSFACQRNGNLVAISYIYDLFKVYSPNRECLHSESLSNPYYVAVDALDQVIVACVHSIKLYSRNYEFIASYTLPEAYYDSICVDKFGRIYAEKGLHTTLLMLK